MFIPTRSGIIKIAIISQILVQVPTDTLLSLSVVRPSLILVMFVTIFIRRSVLSLSVVRFTGVVTRGRCPVRGTLSPWNVSTWRALCINGMLTIATTTRHWHAKPLTSPWLRLYNHFPLVDPSSAPRRSSPLILNRPTPTEIDPQVVPSTPQFSTPPIHNRCVTGVNTLKR